MVLNFVVVKRIKIRKEEVEFESAILKNTIIKIRVLLALGFGEAGSTVIA